MSYYDRQFLGLNPRDFGAKGDGVTDDTAAFQACQAEAIASGISAVSFDDGIYVVGSDGQTQNGQGWILGDIGVDGFLLEGSGFGAVLLLSPTPQVASFNIVGLRTDSNPASKRVTLRNFRIDGNRANIGATLINNTVTGVGINDGEDILVENVIVHDLPGNEGVGSPRRARGIALGGNDATRFVMRSVVRNCIAYDNVGSGYETNNLDEFGTLENCLGYDNFGPDFLLRNLADAPNASRALFVRNCTAVAGPNAVSPFVDLAFSVDSGVTDAGEDIQIDGCTILGRTDIFDSNRVVFDDCIMTAAPGSAGTLRFASNASLASVRNSIVESTNASPVVNMSSAGGGGPKRKWTLRDNVLLGATQGIAGDRVTGEDVEIDGNLFVKTDPTASSASMINMLSESGADSSVRIRRNIFVGNNRDITLVAAQVDAWSSIVIMENFFGCTNVNLCVAFQVSGGGNYGSYPALINNVLGSSKTRLIANTQLPFLQENAYVVGSNYETQEPTNPRGIVRRLITDSTPNGRIFAWVGEEATDITGGAGAIHYVKDSGNLTTSTWVAK